MHNNKLEIVRIVGVDSHGDLHTIVRSTESKAAPRTNNNENRLHLVRVDEHQSYSLLAA